MKVVTAVKEFLRRSRRIKQRKALFTFFSIILAENKAKIKYRIWNGLDATKNMDVTRKA